MTSSQKLSDNTYLIPYIAPTCAFVLFTLLEGWAPLTFYPVVYTFKALIVTAILLLYRAPLRDYQWNCRAILPGLLIGLLVYALWVPVDRHTPFHLALGQRSSFNPYHALPSPLTRYIFLAVRFYGLVVMVPVMEEIFWRSFLLRFLTSPYEDFRQLPLDGFSWRALVLGSLFFALAHPEWLSAFLCGLLYSLLLRYTRTLTAPLIAHMLTNLLLGLYILHTHSWSYW